MTVDLPCFTSIDIRGFLPSCYQQSKVSETFVDGCADMAVFALLQLSSNAVQACLRQLIAHWYLTLDCIAICETHAKAVEKKGEKVEDCV